jgi:hypothetical protein
MEIMHRQALSMRARLAKYGNLESFMERMRKDTAAVPAEERISTIDLYAVYDLVKNLRRLRYEGADILKKHPLQIVDVNFSCILIRANQLLKEIADEIGETLPLEIIHAMRVAPHALELLWDDETQEYCNRDEITGKLIKVSCIDTFMPLYATTLPKERVAVLLEKLQDPKTYNTAFPVPSAPINSRYFDPMRYWQGPTWVNMNWMLADGLERNNQKAKAEEIRQKTIKMVETSGFYEYFSPLDATKSGANTFSWTAALYIDLLQRSGR